MRKLILLGMVCLMGITIIKAQKANLTLSIDKDTIRMGETVIVEYSLENLTGNFVQPDFSGLQLISGPNTSSSFSMINGKVTQSKSYSYVLRPSREGSATIGPAMVKSEDGELSSDEVEVYVLSSTQSKYYKAQKRSFIYDHDMVSDSTSTVKGKKKRIMKKI